MSNRPPGPFLFDPLPDPDDADSREREPEERERGQPRPDDRDSSRRGSATETADELEVESGLPRVGEVEGTTPEPGPETVGAPANPAAGGRRPQQVLFEEPVEDQSPPEARAVDRGRKSRAVAPDRVSPLARLTAGLLDLAAVLAVALAALTGARLLGVEPDLHLLPGVVLFVVAFSFVYHVFPLLFWSRTPGMASAHLITRNPSGQTLTAWQSTLRWAGSLGTVLLAGIPMIVSWFTGWSLADLVSGSETKVDSA